MLYTFHNGKFVTNSIEYSVSYHCNLQCIQCSHLSPYMNEPFPHIDGFKDDLFRLSEVLHAKVIRLLGGEPLLNPDIDKFVAIAKQSGIADMVMVTTNGLLLHRMSDAFWQNVDEVLVSLYPNVSLGESYLSLKQRAKAHNTRLWFQIINSFRTTILSTPYKKNCITTLIYRSCKDTHYFHCHMIHEGMLYKCAVPPFLPSYLATINQQYNPQPDGISIHNNSDLAAELKCYLTDRNALEACRYCLGSLGKRIPHKLLTPNNSPDAVVTSGSKPVTRKNSLDYKMLVKETYGYLTRRLIEKLTGEMKW